MDIFRFNNPNFTMKMEEGEIINGLTSKTWIERFVDAGEFTLTGPVSAGLRKQLPLGCFISHVDTDEIMIVENHEIADQEDQESDITITGRSLETFLENRIVGSNKNFPFSGTIQKYTLAADNIWDQVVALIYAHINAASLIDDDNAISYLAVSTSIPGASVKRVRKIEIGDLYTRSLELMATAKLGIRCYRPGEGSPLGSANDHTLLQIHKGVDRSDTVVFAYDDGEIVSADYLWSTKSKKNAAFVSGKWAQTVVNPSDVGYNRKMIYVDGSEIDGDMNTAPTTTTTPTYASVISQMQQKGIEALANKNDTAFTRVEASKKSFNARYREDFSVGDFVTVLGNYNEETTMRVSEYVEIEDKTGAQSYPTLTFD